MGKFIYPSRGHSLGVFSGRTKNNKNGTTPQTYRFQIEHIIHGQFDSETKTIDLTLYNNKLMINSWSSRNKNNKFDFK